MPERLQPFTEGLADPPEATVTEIPPVIVPFEQRRRDVCAQTQRVHPPGERSNWWDL